MSGAAAVQPALTPDEWREVLNPTQYGWRDADSARAYFTSAGRGDHGTAAVCLYGRPFGFDFVDVARLRKIAQALQDSDVLGWPQYADRLHDVADRIAALLPPTP